MQRGMARFDVEGFDVSTRFTRLLATQSDQLWILLGRWRRCGGGVHRRYARRTHPMTMCGFWDSKKELGVCPVPLSMLWRRTSTAKCGWARCKARRCSISHRPCSTAEGFDAQQILIEQDGNFQFLLETETVWDIALDGGNRKWLATVNNGVFLLSPDGREQVAHFTAENSPLLANEVYDLAIDQQSGMVYFATPMGLTSYRGEATNFRAELDGGGLRIFPNPWRPEYTEQVTIDGLAFGSELHILDASGARVRKVESAGGRAVWDTKDDRGRLVPEGVYYLLAGEDAGKSGASGKMVILR